MTTVIQERDLCRVRLRLVDLCKSLFAEEPDAEKLARWRGIFAALARAQVSSAFAREAAGVAALLWTKGLSELRQEYRRIHAHPLAGRGLTTLTGFSWPHRNNTLAGLRAIMAEAGLVRDPTAPADGLVVLLDIQAALIEMEKDADEAQARELAARLVDGFLAPLAENLRAALESGGNADFYLLCGRLLCSYFKLEASILEQNENVTAASGAKRVFAGLFAATASLTGATMTTRTVFRAADGPKRQEGRRRFDVRPVCALPSRLRRPGQTPSAALSGDCREFAAVFLPQAVREQAVAAE